MISVQMEFPLPLGTGEGLRNFIVALPWPSIYKQQTTEQSY